MNRVKPSDHLDLDSRLDSLPALGHASVGLGTHDTTSPVTGGILVVGLEVAVVDSGDELGELSLVLGADLGKGEDGSGLLVDDRTETGLALDDNVGDTHLAAESGEEDDKLDRVNIVGNDEVGLLLLDETDNVVETVLGKARLLGVLGGRLVSLLGLGLGLGQETRLLLLLGFGLVLVEELEELGGGVLVEGVRELGNCGGDLQTLVKDDLLALETDIFGPLDEPGQVLLVREVTTDTEGLGSLLEKRVGLLLGGLLGAVRGGGRPGLSFSCLGHRY